METRSKEEERKRKQVVGERGAQYGSGPYDATAPASRMRDLCLRWRVYWVPPWRSYDRVIDLLQGAEAVAGPTFG